MFRIPVKYFFLVVASLGAACAALFYRVALEAAEWAFGYVVVYGQSYAWIRLAWFAVLGIVAWQVWRVVVWNPDLAGGGMAHMLAVYDHDMQTSWRKNLAGNLAGGTLSLFGGLSIGNESPVVQMGASAATGVAEKIGGARKHVRELMEGGAATGFAVGFSAPVSGLLFAAWLVGKKRPFSFYFALGLVLAFVYGVIVMIYGLKPYFSLDHAQTGSLYPALWLAPILGVLCAFAGMLFNGGMMKSQKVFDRMNHPDVPRFAVIWGVFMISGVIAFVFPAASGSGAYLIPALIDELPMRFLLVALVVKFLFTLVSPTSGVPGGMMYPVITLGALCGRIFGEAAVFYGVAGGGSALVFMLCGMAGVFAATFKMPFVAFALIIEMTWRIDCVIPVALAVFFAYLTVGLFGARGLYDLLEERILERAGVKKANDGPGLGNITGPVL